MGAGAGLITWGVFSPYLGLGAGLGLAGRYLITGLTVDLLYTEPRRTWAGAAHWAAIGAVGNALKFVVLSSAHIFTGTFSFSLFFGKWPALGTHILFGALGGLAAWAVVQGINKMRDKQAAA